MRLEIEGCYDYQCYNDVNLLEAFALLEALDCSTDDCCMYTDDGEEIDASTDFSDVLAAHDADIVELLEAM